MMDHHGPHLTPTTERFEALLRRWHLADQDGNLTVRGFFAFMWGGMAAGAALISLVLPSIGYELMLALPDVLIFALAGAFVVGFGRWWCER
jgi:uncharacterized membrane protein YoaK (UPF0700 family)